LIFREGIHYKKFSDVPFSGKVTGEKQGILQNGKREGPWVTEYVDFGLKRKKVKKIGLISFLS
jgi:hypothetical protein